MSEFDHKNTTPFFIKEFSKLNIGFRDELTNNIIVQFQYNRIKKVNYSFSTEIEYDFIFIIIKLSNSILKVKHKSFAGVFCVIDIS